MENILIVVSIITGLIVYGGAQLIFTKRLRSFLDSKAERKVTQFELLSAKSVDIVFLGDSLTEAGLWHELFPDSGVVNRGIDGDTTADVLERVDQVFNLKPQKLFLMIGINDLNKKLGVKTAKSNYKKLFDLIDHNLPESEIYIQSVLPVNKDWPYTSNVDIPSLNVELTDQSKERGYTYIDLYSAFSDSAGQLKRGLSNDGLHLLGTGYALWHREIKNFLSGD